MLIEDAFNAIPATACCADCRHCAQDLRGKKKPWCEFLGKTVSLYGWCGDFELITMKTIKQGKSVENS